MGRKRLITDSYPVVKRGEGPAGHSKGELAPELEEEPQAPDVDEAELELLRQFDLAWQYGPCTGITRLQRWHRAQQMGLDPPPEPLASLPTLRCHLGPPAFSGPASHPRASGYMGEPATLPWRNIWQEGVSQGREQAESGGVHGSVSPPKQQSPGGHLGAHAAEAEGSPGQRMVFKGKDLAVTLLPHPSLT
ncbi:DNA polymerase delta subunit 4 isoform X1 [Choloepus didactylus]|uniref:DNA polymerase delta subunit 4 isoform X1 n=1 Tax=Choloepus didactylus TaxID=27675 RepID=UPI0018A003D3|nr:DNA polymerase delta subunit 4 isoform X1 [Choloepus didactylus]